MSLFSFAKDAGKRLAGAVGLARAEAPADSPEPVRTEDPQTPDPQWLIRHIEAALHALNMQIEAEVRVEGDRVILSGTAPTQKARELAVLVCGNIQGVAAVDDQLEVSAPEPEAIHHTVVAGDTLSKIAREVYGVMRMYDVIFEANQPMITDPDEIFPGQVLRIPPVAPPTHTVARGETLGSIAAHWYGEAKRYTDIFEANRELLDSPDAIEVGQVLTIPLIDPKVRLV